MITSLSKIEIETIKKIMSKFLEIDKAVLYGSRAKGSYKLGSDVDIAIFGHNISFETILSISLILNEETSMPYFFDILYYETLENNNIKEEIDNFGITLYERESIILLNLL